MSVVELETHIDRSLTRLRGTFALGGLTYEYCEWDGEQLNHPIAADTETAMIRDHEVPELALLTAYDGSGTVWLIHPSRTGRFVRRHADRLLVFHNVAFDYHVIRRHLIQAGKPKTARIWQDFADQGRIADTMILDQLVRLAAGKFPKRRDLAVLADRYANISDMDKDDPYRVRYGETIGMDWRQVDRGFWQYAAKDPVATFMSYEMLRERARQVVRDYDVLKPVRALHGLLTHRTQVKAAIALADIAHRGIRLDQDKRAEAEHQLRQEMIRLVNEVAGHCVQVFRRTETGQLQLTPAGKPSVNNGKLAEVFSEIANEHDIPVPVTPKTGKPTLARSFWITYADQDPFIELWVRLDEITKLVQFFSGLQDHCIHPSYETMVRSGRTSCHHPNIQQIPRSGNLREMFVPTPGYYLLAIDYSALELRTLAANCERLYEKSVLADVLRSGRDPHVYTAALMLEMKPNEFEHLKETDPDRYSKLRHKAKVINFGIAGGLGAKGLSVYAKTDYGVELTEDEAATFRDRFLDVIYPEIGQYMQSDAVQVLAGNLQSRPRQVLAALGSEPCVLAARRIVQGRTNKRDGTKYQPRFIERVWSALQRLNRNHDLQEMLDNQEAGEQLEKLLFFGPVVTSTGLVRGGATFTMRRNTPFQSDAATGAKLALWELFKRGYRTVAFVHDEFLIELPVGCDYRREAETIRRLICEAMEQVTGDVPIEAEYTLAHRWSKQAELLHDVEGQLVPWEIPAPVARKEPTNPANQANPTIQTVKASDMFGKRGRKKREPKRKLANHRVDPESIYSFIPPPDETMELPKSNVDDFVSFITERHRIYLRRAAGQPPPWTDDPILQEFKFCNPYRENDRATVWLRKEWYEPHHDDPYLFFAMIVARWCNRLPTLDVLGYPVPWNRKLYEETLNSLPKPVWETGAYRTPNVKGMSKIAGQATLLDAIWKDRDQIAPAIGETLAGTRQVLSSYPGFGSGKQTGSGDFLAGQIVADLKMFEPLRSAPDYWTWAVPGPGSKPGLNWVLGRDPKTSWDVYDWVIHARKLRKEVSQRWPSEWTPLCLQNIQNCLCEFNKLCRIRNGAKLRRYVPRK